MALPTEMDSTHIAQ